jgi:hypothetical protein
MTYHGWHIHSQQRLSNGEEFLYEEVSSKDIKNEERGQE